MSHATNSSWGSSLTDRDHSVSLKAPARRDRLSGRKESNHDTVRLLSETKRQTKLPRPERADLSPVLRPIPPGKNFLSQRLPLSGKSWSLPDRKSTRLNSSHRP